MRKGGREQMDEELRPTWKLAWGLWWRGVLITLGIAVIIGVIMLILHVAGVTGMPWEGHCAWMPGW
jgi:hypothetical protein